MSTRTLPGVSGLVLLLTLAACRGEAPDGQGAAGVGGAAPAQGGPALAAYSPAKAQAAVARLGTATSKDAEDELVGMGKPATVELASFMVAQDGKAQSAAAAQRYDLRKPVLRAIAVCQRIGPDAEPAVMLLHKATKDSATRTTTCGALKKFGSACPAGDR